MMSTLGGFIAKRMEQLGLNQTELADLCDVPRLTINRLVRNKTALPDAEIRRRLAKGLGVSHIDLLVAAGELAEDEVEDAGVQGVVDDSPRQLIIDKLDEYQWNYDSVVIAIDFIDSAARLYARAPKTRNAAGYRELDGIPPSNTPTYIPNDDDENTSP